MKSPKLRSKSRAVKRLRFATLMSALLLSPMAFGQGNEWDYSASPGVPTSDEIRAIVNFDADDTLVIDNPFTKLVLGEAMSSGNPLKVFEDAGMTPLDRDDLNVQLSGAGQIIFGTTDGILSSNKGGNGSNDDWTVKNQKTFEILTGTVQFGGNGLNGTEMDGSYDPDADGGDGGSGTMTVVTGGTLKLGAGTTLKLGGEAGTGQGTGVLGIAGAGAFILDGGTLSVGEGTEILTDTFDVDNGGILSVDLNNDTTFGTGLTLASGVTSGVLTVNALNVDRTVSGSYTLLAGTGFSGANITTGTINGDAPDTPTGNDRFGAASFDVAATAVSLNVTAGDINRLATWVGGDAAGPMVWSQSVGNWSVDKNETPSKFFLHGDATLFDATGEQGTVEVDAAGVRVAQVGSNFSMRIAAGSSYNFTGGNVTGQDLQVDAGATLGIDNTFIFTQGASVSGTLTGSGTLIGNAALQNRSTHKIDAGETFTIVGNADYKGGSTIQAGYGSKIAATNTTLGDVFAEIDMNNTAPSATAGLTLDGTVSQNGELYIAATNVADTQVGDHVLIRATDAAGSVFNINNIGGMVNGRALKTSLYGNDRFAYETFAVQNGGKDVVLKVIGDDVNRSVTPTNFLLSENGGKARMNDGTAYTGIKQGDHLTIATPGTYQIDDAGFTAGKLPSQSEAVRLSLAQAGDVTFTGGALNAPGQWLVASNTYGGYVPGVLTFANSGANAINIEMKQGILAGATTIVGDVILRAGTALSPGNEGSGTFSVWDGDLRFEGDTRIFIDINETTERSDKIFAGSTSSGYSTSGNVLLAQNGGTTTILLASSMDSSQRAEEIVIVQANRIYLGTEIAGSSSYRLATNTYEGSMVVIDGYNNSGALAIMSVEGGPELEAVKTTSQTIAVTARGTRLPGAELGMYSMMNKATLQHLNSNAYHNYHIAKETTQSMTLLDGCRFIILNSSFDDDDDDDDDEIDRIRRYDDNYPNDREYHSEMDQIRGQSPCGPVGCGKKKPHYSLYGEGFGSFMSEDASGDLPGYDVNLGGVQVGLAGKPTKNTSFGYMLSGAWGKLKSSDGKQRGDIDQFYTAFFGGVKRDNWHLAWNVGYGLTRFDAERFSDPFTITSKHDTNSFTAGLELSRDIKLTRRSSLTPYLSYNFVYMDDYDFTERGGYRDLKIHSKHLQSHLQTLGLRYTGVKKLRGSRALALSLSGGWQHDYDDGGFYTVGQYGTGNPFVAPGVERSRDSGLVGVGLHLQTRKTFAIFARYDGEFGKNYDVQNVSAGFNWLF